MTDEAQYFCDRCGGGPFTVWEIRVKLPPTVPDKRLCVECAKEARREFGRKYSWAASPVATLHAKMRRDYEDHGKDVFPFHDSVDPAFAWYISQADCDEIPTLRDWVDVAFYWGKIKDNTVAHYRKLIQLREAQLGVESRPFDEVLHKHGEKREFLSADEFTKKSDPYLQEICRRISRNRCQACKSELQLLSVEHRRTVSGREVLFEFECKGCGIGYGIPFRHQGLPPH